MSFVRRSFYMLLGFSFPFFWGYHMEGFANLLYRPIQLITATESTMWPSFITAFLSYIGLIVLIERVCRREEVLTNEWDDHRQLHFLDDETLLLIQRNAKERELLQPRKLTAGRKEPCQRLTPEIEH